MNDQELRALVRAAVERHLGPRAAAGGLQTGSQVQNAPYPQLAASSLQSESSHYVYVSLVNTGDACVIEPGVPCNHCNYCKSHGH